MAKDPQKIELTGIFSNGYGLCPKLILQSPELTDIEKLVWLLLSSYAGQKDNAWPGIPTMAADLGKSKNTIMNAVKRLVEYDYIRKRRTNKGNTYYLNLNLYPGKRPSSREQNRNSRILDYEGREERFRMSRILDNETPENSASVIQDSGEAKSSILDTNNISDNNNNNNMNRHHDTQKITIIDRVKNFGTEYHLLSNRSITDTSHRVYWTINDFTSDHPVYNVYWRHFAHEK